MKWQNFLGNQKSSPLKIVIIAIWLLIALGLVISRPYNYLSKTYNHSPITNVQKIKHTNQAWLVFQKHNGKFNSANTNDIDANVHNLQVHKSHYGLTKIVTPDTNATDQQNYISKNHKAELVHLYFAPSKAYPTHLEQVVHATHTSDGSRYLTGSKVATQAYASNLPTDLAVIASIGLIVLFFSALFITKSFLCTICNTVTLWVAMELLHLFTFSSNQLMWQPYLLLLASLTLGISYLFINDYFNSQKDKYNAFTNTQKYIFPLTVILIISSAIWNWQLSCMIGLTYLAITTLLPSLQSVLPDDSGLPKAENVLNKPYTHHPSRIKVILFALIFLIGTGYSATKLPTYFQNYKGTSLLKSKNSDTNIKTGKKVINHNFNSGYIYPDVIQINSPKSLYNENTLMKIDNITQRLKTKQGIANVKSITQPTGNRIPQLYVKNQLSLLTGKKKNNKEAKLNNNATINNNNLDELKNIGNEADNINIALKNTSTGIKAMSKSQKDIAKTTIKQLTDIQDNVKKITTNSNQLGNQMENLQHNLTNANSSITKLNSSFKESHGYLNSLQNSKASNQFYVPKDILDSKAYHSAKVAFVNKNNHQMLIKVYFKHSPRNKVNVQRTDSLQKQVYSSLRGTGLHARVTSHGQSASLLRSQKLGVSNAVRLLVALVVLFILIGAYIKSLTVLYPLMASIMASIISLTIIHFSMPLFSMTPYSVIVLTTMVCAIISFLTIPHLITVQDYLMIPQRQKRIQHFTKVINSVLINLIILNTALFLVCGSLVSVELGSALGLSFIILLFFISDFNSFLLMITKKLYE